jgi:hypothetical protein
LFVALAIATTALLHPSPLFAQWSYGKPLAVQLWSALAFAMLCGAAGVVVVLTPGLRRRVRTPEGLHQIDLSGARPWVVGLCAGVGEELLFRAALQPLVGLWIGSAIFAAAHVRTATLGGPSLVKRLAYLLNVAAAGVALGLVFQHLGLAATILIHATIDVVGLLVLRSSASQSAQASAA